MSNTGLKKEYIHHILFLLILILAFVLRVWNIGELSFSNDELSAIKRLSANSVYELWEKGVRPDGHPAFVQTLLFYWFKLVPVTEFNMRILFVIAGTLSIAFFYRIALRQAGVGTALWGAATMAGLQYFIMYSQLARPYAFGLLFTLMCYDAWSAYFFSSKTSGHKNLVYFILAGIAAMYTHYFSFLMVLIFSFYGLFLVRRKNISAYFIAGMLMILLFIPHFSITLRQLSEGGVGGPHGWLNPPKITFLFEYVWYVFNSSIFIAFIMLVLFVVTIISYYKIHSSTLSKFQFQYLLFWIIPILTGYLYSIWRNPVLQFSVVIFSFPFFLLYIFSYSSSLKRNVILIVTMVILTCSILSTILEKKYYQRTHWAEFKRIASAVCDWKEKYNNDLYVMTSSNDKTYFDFYFKNCSANPTDKFIQDEQMLSFRKMINEIRQPYLCFAFSNKDISLEWFEMIKEKYPYVLSRSYYFNSEIWLFSKENAETSIVNSPLHSFDYSFVRSNWESNNEIANDSLKIRSDEYIASFEKPIKDLISATTDIITFESTITSTQQNANPHLVFTLVDKHGKEYFWKGNPWNTQCESSTCRMFVSVRMTMEKLDLKNDKLKCYLWNPSKDTILIHQMKIRVEQGNPIIFGYP
jgi:hypothetical protein